MAIFVRSGDRTTIVYTVGSPAAFSAVGSLIGLTSNSTVSSIAVEWFPVCFSLFLFMWPTIAPIGSRHAGGRWPVIIDIP
jgi:hypothetical protein